MEPEVPAGMRYEDLVEEPAAFAPPVRAPEPRLAEAAPDVASEDLWSEVSLRDRPTAPLAAEPALAEDSFWGGAPQGAVEEDVFEEVTTARLDSAALAPPPPAPVDAPPAPPAALAPVAPPIAEALAPRTAAPEVVEALPPAAPPPPAEPAAEADGARLEALVAARLEDAVRKALEPLASDLARRIVEEVAWEVVPDLAEAMIRREIERVRREAGSA